MAERSSKSLKGGRVKVKLTAKEKAQAKAESELPGKKEGTYLLCGLAALAVSVYTLVSLISYLFTWADDQSLFDNEGVFSAMMQVENGGGAIGLVWANFLISKLFGLGAFIIPFFFGGVALFCLKIKKIRVLRFFFLSLFGCVILSVAFSFLFSFTQFDSWFGNGAGGSYGHYITVWLKMLLGNTGAAAVILFAVIAWMVAVNNRVVAKFNSWIDKITAPRPKKAKKDADEEMSAAAGEEGGAGTEGMDAEGVDGEGVEGEDGEELSGKELDLGNGERVNTATGEISYEIRDEEEADEDGIVDLSEDGAVELDKVDVDEIGNSGDENGEVELEVLSAPDAPVGNDIAIEPEKKRGEDDFLSELSEDAAASMLLPDCRFPSKPSWHRTHIHCRW